MTLISFESMMKSLRVSSDLKARNAIGFGENDEVELLTGHIYYL
jgi:hypothetical protein